MTLKFRYKHEIKAYIDEALLFEKTDEKLNILKKELEEYRLHPLFDFKRHFISRSPYVTYEADIFKWKDENPLYLHLQLFKNYFYGDFSIYLQEVGSTSFAHFLRLCYQILNLIETHEGLSQNIKTVPIEPTELQKRYAKIFRAHLTKMELEVLLFNGASEYGQAKLKPLLEKYAMFAHLNCTVDDEVKNRTHIFDYAHHYQPCAFGKDEEWAEYFDLHNTSLEQWKSKYHIDQYGINDYLKKAIWK